MSDHGSGADDLGSPLAVLDIDGVLADVRHRLHHLSARPRDWDAFFAAAGDDPVLAEGRSAVEDAVAEHLRVVYLTGRPERCRAITRSWLEAHGFPAGELQMRPDRDRRPARFYKVEALRRLGRVADVAYVVDDDADVIAAVREAGFTARHATWLPREGQTLHEAQETEGRT